MLDIFQKIRKKKAKIKEKPKIIGDIHEKKSLVISELINSNQINLEIKSLKIGDYLIGNTIIERKTSSDFISSMLNKRLLEQLKQLEKYKQALLIIEGGLEDLYDEERKLNPNAVRGFIISISLNYNIPIIFTKDYEDTSKYLITLAKQQLKPITKHSLHSRIPKTKEEQKQYILESFPNIGPKKAELLLKDYKTLSNIFNSSEEQLSKILRKQAKDFKSLLDN